MEQDMILKAGGIIIVVVMALSMIAVAGISVMEQGTNSGNGSNINTNPIVTPYAYDLEFNTSAIKELNSFRMVAGTTHLTKTDIDNAIKDIDGISKISSEFRKAQDSSWLYYAEITLKKTAVLDDAINNIYALEYFDTGEKVAMKYMTISSPGELELYNKDLDINRNFTFAASTLPALVGIETMPGDEISVSGTVTLKGKEVTALELMENNNITGSPQYFSTQETLQILTLGEDLLFEGQTSDQNIDQNYYKEQLALIDSDSQIYFMPDENTIRFAGQSKVINSEAIANLFSEIDSMSMFQDATFNLTSVYITELDKDLELDSNIITAQVRLGHSVDDEVDLTLNLFVERDTASVMQGIEN